MKVFSNQPGLQVYTGNFMNEHSPVWAGKKGMQACIAGIISFQFVWWPHRVHLCREEWSANSLRQAWVFRNLTSSSSPHNVVRGLLYIYIYLYLPLRNSNDLHHFTCRAICLETQNWPDAVNQRPPFPDPVLYPEGHYRHVTLHRFQQL
jgi:galactose mutarotase-like enzyme